MNSKTNQYSDLAYYSTRENQIEDMEREFFTSVNNQIANRVTPVYNAFCLISAAIFGYFCCID